MKRKSNHLAVLGLTHLGLVYAAGFAKVGQSVSAFDPDSQVMSQVLTGKLPIFEPGLDEIFFQGNKKPQLCQELAKAVQGANYVFITLDLEVTKRDRLKLNRFAAIIEGLLPLLPSHSTLVICSQVPLGTCRQIEQKLRKAGKLNHVIYFPENLRLGTALENFLHPDRWILGATETFVTKKFLKDFSMFKTNSLIMSLESAEMSKHATNAYLALNISLSSELGDLCELTGADLREVVAALRADTRVSPKAPIDPGLGFAGGTLGRDLQSLLQIGRNHHYMPRLTAATYRVNKQRLPHLVDRIKQKLGTLKGKQIGILGLTYKPNTNTLRRSQSVELAQILLHSGAKVRAYDPQVVLAPVKHLDICSPESLPKQLDAIILMTPWPEFKGLLNRKFLKQMKQPNLFDAKNYFDAVAMTRLGFTYYGVGFIS